MDFVWYTEYRRYDHVLLSGLWCQNAFEHQWPNQSVGLIMTEIDDHDKIVEI